MSENPNPTWRLRRGTRRGEPAQSVRPDAVTELLAELTTVDPTEAAALREFLTAASAPAAPGELAGEAAALAAFRAARPLPLVQVRSRAPRNFARLLTVKAAAITVAITATGGVALAATTGALPVPSTITPARPTTGKVTPHPRAGEADSGGSRNATGTLDSGALSTDPPAGPAAGPTAGPVVPTAAPGNGLHLGWCKGVGNPHNTPANCGTTTTTGGSPTTVGTTGNVNGSGKTPPGWCKNPNNPHYDPTACGATTTSTAPSDNGPGNGNGNGNGNGHNKG